MPELERRVRAALHAEAPAALIEGPGPCPQAAIDRDLALLDAVLRGDRNPRLVRIWANPRCVVVSKRLAAREPLAAIERRLEGSGAAVAVRASGGTAVVHRPGVLNISVVGIDEGAAASMEWAYANLTDLLGRALARLGIQTHRGRAVGAYCDGDHNLLWQGRKLAGTAAVVRRRGGRTARLVHASLLVWGDPADDVRLVALAEGEGVPDGGYSSLAHVSVRGALSVGNGDDRRELMACVRRTCDVGAGPDAGHPESAINLDGRGAGPFEKSW